MRTFESIADAREAIMDFRADHFGTLSADDQTEFKRLASSPSPVDQIVGVMELLYARRADLDDAGHELLGGLAAFATVNAWHGLQEDARGNKIVQAARRDLGEKPPAGMKFAKVEDDPEVKPQYRSEPAASPGE